MAYYRQNRKKTLLAYIASTAIVVSVVAMVFVQANFLQVGRFFYQSSAYTKSGQGAYNFSCLRNNGCYTKPDSDSTKAACYTSCRNADVNASKINKSQFADNEKSFMTRFLQWYSRTDTGTGRLITTRYGDWRSYATGDMKGAGDSYGNMYRTQCNTAAVAALNGKLTNKPLSYYYNLADQITSIFDDHYYWNDTAKNDQWVRGVTAYPCVIAASLLWDKLSANTDWDRFIGKTNRSVEEKKTMMRNAIAATAQSIYSDYPDPEKKYATVEEAQRAYGPGGNSQAEEAAWNAAFLAMASNMLPNHSSKAAWENHAKNMMVFSYKSCADAATCPIGADFRVINHGVNPQPQYGMSVIMLNARAALPYYVFGGFDRERIPSEFRMLGVNKSSVYTAVNVFEFQSSAIDYSTMSLSGPYTYQGGSGNYTGQTYGNQTGVSEWGYGADMNVSPFAYMYAVADLTNWNGYQSTQGPVQAYIDAEKSKALSNTLYIPTITNAQGKWVYEYVDSARRAKLGYMVNFGGGFSNATNDERINTHFFLNSLKAFEHMISFLYLNNQNYLTRLQ